MFKNYLKTTWRSFMKDRAFAILNVVGLSIGIAAFLLITLYVRDELTYDKFHPNVDRIYRGMAVYQQGFRTGIPDDAIDLAKENMPEIEAVTRISYGTSLVMEFNGAMVFENEVYRSDPALFDIFDFSLKLGNPSDPFLGNTGVVLSQYMVDKYYNGEDPIGKVFKSANSEKSYFVTGVLNEIPENSRFRFNVLMPFEKTGRSERPWYPSGLMYVLLNEEVSDDAFGEKLKSLALENGYPGEKVNFLFENYGELYLNSPYAYTASGLSGNKEFVYIFSIVAVLLLALACINYVNLSTARSLSRLKEVGVRKVVGASRSSIRNYLYFEAALFAFFAVIIAAGLAEYFLPQVNALSGKSLRLQYFSDPFILPFLILIIPTITLMAGFYPAIFVSRFQMLKVLKGEVSGGKGHFRRVLVVFQLVITLALLFGNQVVQKQMDAFLAADVGLNPENIITTSKPRGIDYDIIKSALEQVPGVEAVTSSSYPGTGSSPMPLKWTIDNEEKQLQLNYALTPLNVTKTLGIQIVKGRDFNMETEEDWSNHILIDESTAAVLGFDDPIGKSVRVKDFADFSDVPRTIIGVFKDLHFNLKREAPRSIIIPHRGKYLNELNIKLSAANQEETVLRIEEVWYATQTEGLYTPFEYSFMADRIEARYGKEKKFGQIIQYFAGIAILIAALGLFGLSAFMVVQRYKEIGIRKVLGASALTIFGKFIKGYMLLVLIALVIAAPLAYYLLSGWLTEFAYQIDIGLPIFLVGFVGTCFVVVLTVGFHSIKAAIMNPVLILRDE